VAAALSEHEGDATKALDQVLGDLLEGEQGQCAGLRDHLKAALRGEGVLLLFDGLDELPAEAPEGGLSPRVAVTEAIRRLERWTRARIVVTSRVLPYRTARDWQLPADEGWQVRTIQPLAFGQVQTFVTSWYAALAGTDPELPLDTAEARAEALTDELADSPALRPLIASPLLLTMLAILHYNTDEVPRDRARLYEECVQLLLERWEPVRTPGLRRPGLLERLGNVPGLELDLLRGTIHELAFKAHSDPPGDDGRGVIDGDALHGRMLKLFRAVRSAEPDRAVATFEQVLREDAGLLQARADGHYAFPHLTFQEYLAACYLANQPQTVELAQARWHSPDAERWREVLRLLVGRLRQQGKVQDKVLPWLEQLIAERVGKQVRPIAERRRDAVLATLVYRELGEVALASSTVDLERRIEAPLREALVALLAEHDPAIVTADRVRAGFLLGELGDPRFPVTLDEWRREVARMRAGDTSGYFCRIEPGTYWIGSADDDPESDENEKPLHQIRFEAPFWVGRYPITNVQWQAWVEAGGEAAVYASDTLRGPMVGITWQEAVSRPNQPVVGITWDMTIAFCVWLSEQLGVEVRLPGEAEWEVAARGPEGWRYPWGDRWEVNRSSTKEDQQTRGWFWSIPVGCYPSGAAQCGAIDMAGNVWEWTSDVWRSFSGTKKPFMDEVCKVVRGGSSVQDGIFSRCAARARSESNCKHSHTGFRVLLL
jgi:formylglycine-generating enzyme required for sulfatase activity